MRANLALRASAAHRRRPTKMRMPFEIVRPGVLAEPSQPPVHFSSDPNSIVDVTVSTILAPTPNNHATSRPSQS